MPIAWRVVKARYADAAFSGEGAALYGGRWNSRRIPAVYASGSKALAALEILVHLNPPVHFSYVAFRIEIPDDQLETLSFADLPRVWQAEPPPPATKHLGYRWIRSGRSVAWQVPSVIVSGEFNYVLNPAHPAFKELRISDPVPFALDPRLLR